MHYGMPTRRRRSARVGRRRRPRTGMTWMMGPWLASKMMTMMTEICYELHLMWEYWLLI